MIYTGECPEAIIMFVTVNKRLRVLVLACAIAILPSSAQEVSNADPERACSAAQNQMELNQCAGEQYHKADARLKVVYRKALVFMHENLADAQKRNDTNQISYSRQSIDKLKAVERVWLQYRDLHCEAARHEYEGGSMSPMVWGFCMAQTTLDRVRELKTAYEDGDRKLE